nr:MAG TPA: hypothetical protein [Caudoviricetes sp.]
MGNCNDRINKLKTGKATFWPLLHKLFLKYNIHTHHKARKNRISVFLLSPFL